MGCTLPLARSSWAPEPRDTSEPRDPHTAERYGHGSSSGLRPVNMCHHHNNHIIRVMTPLAFGPKGCCTMETSISTDSKATEPSSLLQTNSTFTLNCVNESCYS